MNMMSENISELMGALAKAQGKIQAAVKDTINPFFKTKYADLSSVWEACRLPLSENGLAVVQSVCQKETGAVLITILGHSSGQWIQSEMAIELKDKSPQTLGSVLTYCRRYSLAAMVGVAPDDDDGEKAQTPYRKEENQPKIAVVKEKPSVIENVPVVKISKSQSEELENLFANCDPIYKKLVLASICETYKADSFTDLPLHVHGRVRAGALKNIEVYSKTKKSDTSIPESA